MELTKLDAEILRHRLEVPECIAEALADHPLHEVELICDELLRQAVRGAIDLPDSGQIWRDVLCEAVEGSTYCGASMSAADDGEITQAKHRAAVRAAESLAAKIGKSIGRKVVAMTV